VLLTSFALSRLCLDEAQCVKYEQRELEENGEVHLDTHCSGMRIPVEDRDYWQTFTGGSDGRN
jgi:hypothetical protein